MDVVPLDLVCALPMSRPDSEWIPRRSFDGTNVLSPPGTRIREDAAGNWFLLNADGSPTSFQMPRCGYDFDDVSFNRGDHIDPVKFRPVSDISDEHLALLRDHGRSLYRNTDCAILGWGFGVCFLGLSLITDRTSNVAQGLTNKWMMMLMTEKETCHEMMNRSVEATIKCLKLVNEAVGECVFAWGIAAEITARDCELAGTHHAPPASPSLRKPARVTSVPLTQPPKRCRRGFVTMIWWISSSETPSFRSIGSTKVKA